MWSRRPRPAHPPARQDSLIIFHVINDIFFQRRAGAAGLVLGWHLPRHPDDLRLEPGSHVGVPSVDVLVDLRGKGALSPAPGQEHVASRADRSPFWFLGTRGFRAAMQSHVPAPGLLGRGTAATGVRSLSGGPSWALWGVEQHPWSPPNSMPGSSLVVMTTNVPRYCRVSPGGYHFSREAGNLDLSVKFHDLRGGSQFGNFTDPAEATAESSNQDTDLT